MRGIKESGGRALVQSPAEAEFEALPRDALAYDGKIDMVAPVSDLAIEVGRLVGGDHIRVVPETARRS